ncbi:S41 family peptidase [Euzebya sp.]|uniref:S41 family peptidase n=1 Tax=Euzebya sp. TaxID=1971409 RepID=UPI0035125736
MDEPTTPPPSAAAARPSPLRSGEFTSALAAGIVMLLIGGTGIMGFRVGAQAAEPDLPDEFTNVELLYEAITEDAVDHPDPDALVSGAIDGLLGTLDDPYAVYYDPERYEQLNADLDGEFVGVGVTIEEQTDGVYITGVIPGSPAEEAGVMAGERITSVDGTDTTTEETTSGDVVELIAGEEGQTRTIGLDSGDAGPRELTLTLREIDLPTVAGRILDSGYGYVGLAQFTRHAAEQLTDELRTFADQGVPGVVLDLRGNPGGLLDEAVDVVSLFVEEGTVVTVESNLGTTEHRVSGTTVAPDLPLVVLVDGNSASASEIVAGALQDLDRAEVVGQTTFGKGTVQTIQDLSEGAGVKFTTAEYFTPSGDSIQDVGVEPDVTASGDAAAMLASAEDVLADLIAAGTATDEPAAGGS